MRWRAYLFIAVAAAASRPCACALNYSLQWRRRPVAGSLPTTHGVQRFGGGATLPLGPTLIHHLSMSNSRCASATAGGRSAPAARGCTRHARCQSSMLRRMPLQSAGRRSTSCVTLQALAHLLRGSRRLVWPGRAAKPRGSVTRHTRNQLLDSRGTVDGEATHRAPGCSGSQSSALTLADAPALCITGARMDSVPHPRDLLPRCCHRRKQHPSVPTLTMGRQAPALSTRAGRTVAIPYCRRPALR
jgi:hypothetical protein